MRIMSIKNTKQIHANTHCSRNMQSTATLTPRSKTEAYQKHPSASSNGVPYPNYSQILTEQRWASGHLPRQNSTWPHKRIRNHSQQTCWLTLERYQVLPINERCRVTTTRSDDAQPIRGVVCSTTYVRSSHGLAWDSNQRSQRVW